VSRIVDIVFPYTHRQTGVTESYFVRVDVTEEFPFLVTKMSPYLRTPLVVPTSGQGRSQ